MTFVIFIGSGAAASAGSGSSDPLSASESPATTATDQVTDAVSDTTEQVSGQVEDTTDQVTDAVSDTTEQVSETASNTDRVEAGGGSPGIGGTSTSGSTATTNAGDSAWRPGATEVARRGVARSGPFVAVPLTAGGGHAVASLRLAVVSAGEMASLGASGCRLHRGGDPIACPDRAEPPGDEVLGLVLGFTGIALLSLLALAAALGGSGSASLELGRRISATARPA